MSEMQTRRWVAVACRTSFLLCLACMSCGRKPDPSAEIRGAIRNQLAKIKSYEMDVAYIERAKDDSIGRFLQRDCLAAIAFAAPRQLRINATARLVIKTGNETRGKITTVYSTFDGKLQKTRVCNETGGRIDTNSMVLDMAINDSATPFNGVNLNGFGLQDGKDYIGTVETILEEYDLLRRAGGGDSVQYSGELNTARCVKLLSRTMPLQQAQRVTRYLAGMSVLVRVDTKRNLVTGLVFREARGKTQTTRTCNFSNIRINQKVDAGEFVFKQVPGERFKDITADVLASRKPANKSGAGH